METPKIIKIVAKSKTEKEDLLKRLEKFESGIDFLKQQIKGDLKGDNLSVFEVAMGLTFKIS